MILYEMLIGIPPFYDKNREKMFDKIKNRSPKFPNQKQHNFSISTVAQDLITSLLQKDISERLGSQQDVTEVLSHPFFESINIDDLYEQNIEAPFKPEVNDDVIDLSNFDSELTKEEARMSIIDNSQREIILQKTKPYFKDFDNIAN